MFFYLKNYYTTNAWSRQKQLRHVAAGPSTKPQDHKNVWCFQRMHALGRPNTMSCCRRRNWQTTNTKTFWWLLTNTTKNKTQKHKNEIPKKKTYHVSEAEHRHDATEKRLGYCTPVDVLLKGPQRFRPWTEKAKMTTTTRIEDIAISIVLFFLRFIASIGNENRKSSPLKDARILLPTVMPLRVTNGRHTKTKKSHQHYLVIQFIVDANCSQCTC